LTDAIQYDIVKGIKFPVETQGSAAIKGINVVRNGDDTFGQVLGGDLILEGLAQDVTVVLKIASCSYHFDTEKLLDSWEAKEIFTCILIAKWSISLTDSRSRWVGLILWPVKYKRNTYVRAGLLNGPAYEDDMLGWERRELTII
jgi:hypothetical protein